MLPGKQIKHEIGMSTMAILREIIYALAGNHENWDYPINILPYNPKNIKTDAYALNLATDVEVIDKSNGKIQKVHIPADGFGLEPGFTLRGQIVQKIWSKEYEVKVWPANEWFKDSIIISDPAPDNIRLAEVHNDAAPGTKCHGMWIGPNMIIGYATFNEKR